MSRTYRRLKRGRRWWLKTGCKRRCGICFDCTHEKHFQSWSYHADGIWEPWKGKLKTAYHRLIRAQERENLKKALTNPEIDEIDIPDRSGAAKKIIWKYF